MVIDTLENLEKYATLNPLFKDVCNFLKNNDLNALEEGKHFIKEKDLFVNIQTAKGKTKEDSTRHRGDIRIHTTQRPTGRGIQRREGHHEICYPC